MAKVPQKLVTIGAVAAVAVFMTGIVSTLGLQDAYADHNRVVGGDQSNKAASQDGVVNAQVGVNANVQVGKVCVQALADSPNC
jgi:hypothetical protein